MNSESMIERVPGLMATPVDGEIVFLNPSSDNYVAIDAVGRRVWEVLEQPRRFGDLVDTIGGEFTGPRARIEDDLAVFLGELQSEGMVRFVEPSTR